MKYETLATVRSGELQMTDRRGFTAAFSGWPDGDVWVRFDAALTLRTREQNRYWHAAIVRPLAAHCEVSPWHMHEALKVKLLPEVVIMRDRDGNDGDPVTIGGSTTGLTQNEAANLLSRGDALVVAAGLDVKDRRPTANTAVCPKGRRHWWYWVGFNVLKCKYCEQVKYAER